MNQINATTKCGTQFRFVTSHVVEHEVPRDLIEAAVRSADFRGQDRGVIRVTYDVGRKVGKCGCVETTDKDQIEFITRGNRAQPSRMVRNRVADDTSLVTVVLVRKKKLVITAYFGPQAPCEPWDTRATSEEREEAKTFWSNHALIVGTP